MRGISATRLRTLQRSTGVISHLRETIPVANQIIKAKAKAHYDDLWEVRWKQRYRLPPDETLVPYRLTQIRE